MKILGNILATITSIFYTVVLFAMMIALFASNVFSANYYQDALKDIDMDEIKISDFGGTASEGLEEDASVQDVLVNTLEQAGISEKDAEKIIKNEQVGKVVGTLISDAVGYLAGGEELPQIKYQDALNIVKDKEISSRLEKVPTDEEIKELVDTVNSLIKEKLKGGVK